MYTSAAPRPKQTEKSNKQSPESKHIFLRATQCFLLSGMREDFRMDTSLVLRSALILAVMYSIVVPSCLKP